MDKIYEPFFRELLQHADNLSEYVDSLYAGNEYSDDDLNYIFGVLKREDLIVCWYYDNRAWVQRLTFSGKHYFDDVSEEDKKPRLIELIEQTEEVEKAFHTVGGGRGMIEVEAIYDTQRFQDWIHELQYELQKLSDTYTDDAYIKDTLEMVKRPFKGFRDRKDFTAIKGSLKTIERNKDNYYPVEIEKEDVNVNSRKKPLIFISHASKNKAQIGLLTDMLRAINLQPKQDIFCSSLPGYDIPVDTEDSIFDFLRNSFLNNEIHVFFIHSHEYYESPVCLNEMGAAWALKSKQTSLLLPGFGFGDMKGVINDAKIAIKLDNDITEVKDKLNQVRRILEKEFSLTPVPDTIWEQARDKFIREINRSKEAQRAQPVSKDAIELLKKLVATSGGILLTPVDTTSGISIQVGEEIIASEYPNRREYARWDMALKECLRTGLIEKKHNDCYAITSAGYSVTEQS